MRNYESAVFLGCLSLAIFSACSTAGSRVHAGYLDITESPRTDADFRITIKDVSSRFPLYNSRLKREKSIEKLLRYECSRFDIVNEREIVIPSINDDRASIWLIDVACHK